MNINVENAIKKFFSNPSFQMVYSEAIANALDANARNIDVRIHCNSFSDKDSLCLEIEDDGNGFTDENLRKFSELLQNSDESHKGLGRLIYLAYFREVEITSRYEGKKRSFTFTKRFNPEDVITEDDNSKKKSTTLRFTSYWKDKVANHDFLSPGYLKNYILTRFMPNLYALKKANQDFKITFSLIIPPERETKDFHSHSEEITAETLPEFTDKEVICEGLDLFENKINISYSIKKVGGAGSLITAVSIDNRILPQKLFKEGGIPTGHEVFMILSSPFFNGKTDDEREHLKLDQSEINIIRKVFTKIASEILNEKIPQVKQLNEKTIKQMSDKYPHLAGMFDKEYIGLINEEESVEAA